MEIDCNSWHAKTWLWYHNFESVSSYLEGRRVFHYGDPDERANLCPYVRVVLVYAPVKWLFTRPRLWYTLAVGFLLANYQLYHYHHLLKFWEVGLGATAAVSAIVVLLLAVEWSSKASFADVIVESARNWHRKICPTIRFKG